MMESKALVNNTNRVFFCLALKMELTLKNKPYLYRGEDCLDTFAD
jgi:hypothetical protein